MDLTDKLKRLTANERKSIKRFLIKKDGSFKVDWKKISNLDGTELDKTYLVLTKLKILSTKPGCLLVEGHSVLNPIGINYPLTLYFSTPGYAQDFKNAVYPCKEARIFEEFSI